MANTASTASRLSNGVCRAVPAARSSELWRRPHARSGGPRRRWGVPGAAVALRDRRSAREARPRSPAAAADPWPAPAAARLRLRPRPTAATPTPPDAIIAPPPLPPPGAEEPLPPCKRTVNVADSGALATAIGAPSRATASCWPTATTPSPTSTPRAPPPAPSSSAPPTASRRRCTTGNVHDAGRRLRGGRGPPLPQRRHRSRCTTATTAASPASGSQRSETGGEIDWVHGQRHQQVLPHRPQRLRPAAPGRQHDRCWAAGLADRPVHPHRPQLLPRRHLRRRQRLGAHPRRPQRLDLLQGLHRHRAATCS